MKDTLKKLFTLGLLLFGSSAVAFELSEPFLCAVTQVHQCRDGFGCEAVLPEDVSAPTFIWVDVKGKHLKTNRNAPGTRINRVTTLENRHILQGAEDGVPDRPDGAGWTISIENETGRFVGAIAVAQASITLFGACTELE
ncbi:MAG: hypothetical protein ACC642_01925 [Pseudomonadales bacterium]